MFARLVHEWGLNVVFFPSSAIVHGPSSKSRPVEELHPGPPLSQRTRGSLLGLLLDSKNLRSRYMDFGLRERNCDEPEEQMFSVCNVEIARILLDRRIAKVGLPRPELVVREGRVLDQFDFIGT